MPFVVKPPLYQKFNLPRVDAQYNVPEGEESTVTIRQATIGANERIEVLNESYSRIYDSANPDQVELKQRMNIAEIQRTQAFLTIVGSNLQIEKQDKNGKVTQTDLFKFREVNGQPTLDMTEEEFKEVWNGITDPLIVEEIMDKVYEVNKRWDPRRFRGNPEN